MTGAEHYAEAERLLRVIRDKAPECMGREVVMPISELLTEAQIHATLALAASQLRSLPATQAATN